MEILQSEDYTQFALFSQSLGITQIWQSIAVLDAFINNLTVNSVESGNYASSGGSAGFKLSKEGFLRAVGAILSDLTVESGTFNGKLVHNSFETVDEQTGAQITFPGKTMWNT